MTTNDEREALHKIATNAIEVLAVYDKLAGAAFEAALASLPAPTPAAGEAVAWMYSDGADKFVTLRRDTHEGMAETPLYAAPQVKP